MKLKEDIEQKEYRRWNLMGAERQAPLQSVCHKVIFIGPCKKVSRDRYFLEKDEEVEVIEAIGYDEIFNKCSRMKELLFEIDDHSRKFKGDDVLSNTKFRDEINLLRKGKF